MSSRYWPEPTAAPDARRTAIVLVNMGTPPAPETAPTRRYLAEFLNDPRIVEWPRWLWKPILHGIVLRTRPARSAQKYAQVWTPEGSPLAVHTARQSTLLQGHFIWLGKAHIECFHAMRYGQPALAATLQKIKMRGFGRFLIVPMFPQYSATTTASIMDEVARAMRHWRNLPELRFIRSFATDEGYLAALETNIRKHWQRNGGPAQQILFSFHGIPEACVKAGDPYPNECRATAEALARRLGIATKRWQLTFQSRFGRAQWLTPYTQPTLVAMAREGHKSVDVVCPGFLADCLETREEIAITAKAAFLDAGGETFNFIPCLNEREDWMAALARLTLAHLGEWSHGAAEPSRD